MILILSFTPNDHVDEVRRHLTAPHEVVDVAWFPAQLGLAFEADAAGSGLVLRLPDGRGLDLADVGAVWRRRIRPYGLDDELVDDTARLFAWSECDEALSGVWHTLPSFWMNSPMADEVAQRKIHQLRVAQAVGLTVPETLVTNEPERARDFVERLGPDRVIRKAFRNIAEAPRQTALVGRDGVARLASVRYAPVIFQRFVSAEADLRVTIVDGDVFAAEIISSPAHAVDYRTGLADATVRPCRLPDAVTDALLRLMQHLGVAYGAIDLRRTPDGDHVFLEINPAGEYLFVARRTGQPIAAAIAAALQRHDAARVTPPSTHAGDGPRPVRGTGQMRSTGTS